VAVGAAPFGEMPSNREILKCVEALVPKAAQIPSAESATVSVSVVR
jgi:hypothetical protein